MFWIVKVKILKYITNYIYYFLRFLYYCHSFFSILFVFCKDYYLLIYGVLIFYLIFFHEIYIIIELEKIYGTEQFLWRSIKYYQQLEIDSNNLEYPREYEPTSKNSSSNSQSRLTYINALTIK